MMERQSIKSILRQAWPFLVLALLIFLAWDYIRQFLPAGEDRPAPLAPAAVYERREGQEELAPMGYRQAMDKEEAFFSAEEVLELYGEGQAVKDAGGLVSALKSAKAGAVIYLGPGEYRVNLELSQDITIVGAGSSTVLLAADPERPAIKSVNSKFVLANLAIRDGMIGLSAEGGEARVRRVRFDKLSATACYGTDVKIDFVESYIYNSLSGLKLVNTAGTVKDAIIKDNGKAGVELRQSEIALSGNVITDNKSYGVYADGHSRATLDNNYIADNEGWNVRLEGERRIYE